MTRHRALVAAAALAAGWAVWHATRPAPTIPEPAQPGRSQVTVDRGDLCSALTGYEVLTRTGNTTPDAEAAVERLWPAIGGGGGG